MQKLFADGDGIEFGFTARNKRSYKSLAYHRFRVKLGKNLWAKTVPVVEEARFFDTSDDLEWCCHGGNYWWISPDGRRQVGALGERMAFFPHCANHPGPWHGYPVSPLDDEHYEVPEEVIDAWDAALDQDGNRLIDEVAIDRVRRGKI